MQDTLAPRLGRFYTGTAVILLNSALALLLFNVAIYVGYRLSEIRSADASSVEEKYGLATLAQVYPDWDKYEIAEMLRETWQLNRSFQPYVHFREQPAEGRFVNVNRAGFRYSRNQAGWPPSPDAVNVFVLGGSTTFGYGVPDGSTVPSRLQEFLRAQSTGASAINIYNFGAGSYQSTQEKIWFQELLLHGYVPDLAIFINGLNEFAFPHEPQDSDLIQELLSDHRRARLRMAARLLTDIPMVKLSLQLRNSLWRSPDRRIGTDPMRCDDDSPPQEFLDAIIDRYLANKTQVQALAATYSVRTAFVWQPIPYYDYDTTYHPFHDPCGVNQYARHGYKRFRERLDAGLQTKSLLWAASMQSQHREPLYVDSVHYTEAFSSELAYWIYEKVRDTFE